ncbi:glycosyltransferase family 4 protein [bacterium]|nr:glycosyltransferase family 4 protein [bacterium]
MKILMIAPEPFFEPRGTPFSEYFRIKALSELGHEIDLTTYPIGKDVEIPKLRIFRSMKVPFIHKVKVGPSIQKLFLDFFLFFTVLKLLFKNRYDAIHTHEEACFFGAVLSKLWRIPHVYDMHSSLAQQFINFNVTDSPFIHRILRFFEKRALLSSDAIIAICPYLGEHVRESGVTRKVFVIENTPEADTFFSNNSSGKSEVELPQEIKSRPVVLYAGTFEHYQGLDLLMESIPYVVKALPETVFLLIGGDKNSIEQFRKRSVDLGIEQNVVLKEKVPVEQVNRYLDVAKVLVSPRKSGTNTPLKIYSYLRSGRPIVATNLITHTQVLNPEIAILTEPQPEAFAKGIIEALSNPEMSRMVERARQIAEEKYSYREYLAKTSNLYAYVSNLKDGRPYLKDNISENFV